MAKLRDDLESIRRILRPRGSGLQSTLAAGRIVDLGAAPTAAGRFVAVQPVVLSGDETEGGSATILDAATSPVFAAWLGTAAPVVGDYVILESVANRWVAHRAKPASTCVETDNFCCIPKRALSLLYANVQTGGNYGYPTGLGWDHATTWTGSSGALTYRILAAGGHGVFTINFDYGSTHETYRTESPDPAFGLELSYKVCSPIMLVFRPTGGTSNRLVRLGYQNWSVTQ